MENASKALIIAGGVLIMILLFTLATYLYKGMASQTSEFYSKLEQSDIDEFNHKFLKFNGRGTIDAEGHSVDPLNIQEVVTIINSAKDSNETKKMPVTVTVKLDTTPNMENKTKDELNTLLKEKIDSKFSCVVEYATNSELVGSVTITEITS